MEHLDIISMFWNAGLIVKMVMLFLLIFSLMSWYIIFHKYMLFKKAEQESDDFLNAFWQSKNMAEAYKRAMELRNCPEAAVFRAGFSELQKLKASRTDMKNGASMAVRFASMDNLKRTLRRTESQQLDSFGKLLPFLATTGSATPFVGLFGTVWGIMSSFKDIGIRGSASLAVVAPGISEALVATAAGLAVAIPAVIFFNHYSNKMARIEGSMQNFSDDFLNLVERDILSKLQTEE
ncbi:MAG: protein TolQ [Thermodesulfobacteriota bacterium]